MRYFRLGGSSRLVPALGQRFDFLMQYFLVDAQRWKPQRLYKAPLDLTSVRRQYRHFRWRFSGYAMLFRMGRLLNAMTLDSQSGSVAWD